MREGVVSDIGNPNNLPHVFGGTDGFVDPSALVLFQNGPQASAHLLVFMAEPFFLVTLFGFSFPLPYVFFRFRFGHKSSSAIGTKGKIARIGTIAITTVSHKNTSKLTPKNHITHPPEAIYQNAFWRCDLKNALFTAN